MPLKLTDEGAWKPLWDYAQQRRVRDPEFSDDLEAALFAKGFKVEDAPEGPWEVSKHCDDSKCCMWVVEYEMHDDFRQIRGFENGEAEAITVRDTLNRDRAGQRGD